MIHPTYTNPDLRYRGLTLRPFVRQVVREKDVEEAEFLLTADDACRDDHVLNLLERDALDALVSAAEEVAADTGLFGELLRQELIERERSAQ